MTDVKHRGGGQEHLRPSATIAMFGFIAETRKAVARILLQRDATAALWRLAPVAAGGRGCDATQQLTVRMVCAYDWKRVRRVRR
jgi:hypothetical protein